MIDPGHQLGNHNFPAEINRPVPAGGFTKPCNTTGTSTNGGYAEATFVWQVSRLLAARLRALGATVRMTRHSNRQDRWGPCVDARGRAGNRIGADLKVSIHADGSYAAGARGFHVIAPADRAPWTDDIADSSLRLASAVRAGLVGKRFVGRQLHRRWRRPRRPLRPRHPQPVRRTDRDGRARQHAQRPPRPA